jgi:hypothetical protein
MGPRSLETDIMSHLNFSGCQHCMSYPLSHANNNDGGGSKVIVKYETEDGAEGVSSFTIRITSFPTTIQ